MLNKLNENFEETLHNLQNQVYDYVWWEIMINIFDKLVTTISSNRADIRREAYAKT